MLGGGPLPRKPRSPQPRPHSATPCAPRVLPEHARNRSGTPRRTVLQSPRNPDPDAEEPTMVRAYVLISATPGKAIDVARTLKGQDGIASVDAITGEYDAIAQVQAADIAGIGQLIVEKIQRQDGVFKTITCLAVE